MAKSTDIVVSKSVEVVAPTTTGVMIGGKQYEIAKRVNVPSLKHDDGETIAIRIDAPIRQDISYKDEEIMIEGKKQIVQKEIILNVVRVTELNTEQPFEYVCNAMTADNLRGTYPDDSYVGLSFAILKKGLAPGKRYKETEIVELKEQ